MIAHRSLHASRQLPSTVVCSYTLTRSYALLQHHAETLLHVLLQGSAIKATGKGLPEGVALAPEVPDVQGVRLEGGPQMLQVRVK